MSVQFVGSGTPIVYADNYKTVERPLWYHKRGLSQTSTGYGRKLTSSKCAVLPDGTVRRVYVTCFSNAGTAWIILKGRPVVLR
jgi:hypothetical protein